MDELQRDLPAVTMNRARHEAMRKDVETAVHRTRAGIEPCSIVHAEPARDDQPDTTLRALFEIRREFWKVPKIIFEPGMHRSHHDAVSKRREAEVERLKEVGIGVTHVLLRPCTRKTRSICTMFR